MAFSLLVFFKKFLNNLKIHLTLLGLWSSPVMTTPLHGVGPQFESGQAHFFCASDLVAMIGPCQGSHPGILAYAKIGNSSPGWRILFFVETFKYQSKF